VRQDARVIVGRIAGAFGVKGDIKLISYTEPRADILRLATWEIHWRGDWRPVCLLGGQMHGRVVVARIDLSQDREAAQQLSGADIAVTRDQLPALAPGQYYWADLVGLAVTNVQGVTLGTVTSLLETGAHDVLVVRDGPHERLIPFAQGRIVQHVDVEQGLIRVDWDPEY
jgi:16S rRNA processing protein RimM